MEIHYIFKNRSKKCQSKFKLNKVISWGGLRVLAQRNNEIAISESLISDGETVTDKGTTVGKHGNQSGIIPP